MARQITSPRFAAAEFKRVVYRAYPELGTSLEDIMDPAYFGNVSDVLKAGDMIEVVREDFSGMVTLLVRKVAHGTALVGLVHAVVFDDDAKLEGPAGSSKDDYRVEHTPVDQWRVVRIADGQTIKKDLPSENAAKKALAEHVKAFGR